MQIIRKGPVYRMKDREVPCFKCLLFQGISHLNLEIHIFKHMISIQILMQYEFMILCVKFSRLWLLRVLKRKFLRTKRCIVLEMAC